MFTDLYADQGGRYAYDRQPIICRWNLSSLSVSLDPIISSSLTELLIDKYDEAYKEFYHITMKKKVCMHCVFIFDKLL